MRSPQLGLALIPGWAATGAKLREILEPLVCKHEKDVRRTIDALGSDEVDDLPGTLIDEATLAMEAAFQIPPRSRQPRQIRGDLIAAITGAAQDPDDAISAWVEGNTPLGIINEIPTRGIFPRMPAGAEQGTLREVEELAPWIQTLGNYRSVYENPDEVSEELKKEKDKQFLDWARDKDDLERKVGPVVLSSCCMPATRPSRCRHVCAVALGLSGA